MLNEIFAFLSGTVIAGVVSALVTAGHYRGAEALEVRRAVAKLIRHLETDTESSLSEELSTQLDGLCTLIDNHEDCVARSKWAKRHRNYFLAGCADVLEARQEGITVKNRRSFIEGRQLVQDSGEMLSGFLEFPSRKWCKATVYRLLSPFRDRGKL